MGLVCFFIFTPSSFNRLELCDKGISHPAELSDTRVSGLSQPLGLHRRLTEEEKYLVVIRVFTFWDPKGTNKFWLWDDTKWGKRVRFQFNKQVLNRLFFNSTSEIILVETGT